MPISDLQSPRSVRVADAPKIKVVYQLWSILYDAYAANTPPHRGKTRILNALHNVGLRRPQPFLWRMQNGAVLSISAREASVPSGVGWTCFTQGVWEPHVERALRQIIHPGDTTFDIGANIGYFSAVMAQCVKPNGKVFSFEPVPTTFRQLVTGLTASGFQNVTAFPFALGAESGEFAMNHDPNFPGGDSLYQWNTVHETNHAIQIHVRTLDALVEDGSVPQPDVIKIDIEGHEMAALQGARTLLTEAQPLIVMEFNKNLATLAGWSLQEMSDMLRSCGYQHFYLLDKEGRNMAIDPDTLSVAEDAYIDILASPREVVLQN